MSKSRILIGQNGSHGQIRIDGSGTFESAGAFKQAYLQLLAKGAKDSSSISKRVTSSTVLSSAS